MTDATLDLLLFGTLLMELILSWSGVRWYWSLGIPVYRATRPIEKPTSILPTSKDLREEVNRGDARPFRFFRFSDHEMGFIELLRLRFHSFNYLPVMHGMIQLEPVAQQLKVIGRLQFWPVLGVLLVVNVFARPHFEALGNGLDDFTMDYRGMAFALIGSLVVLAIPFVIQCVRFRNLLEIAAVEVNASNIVRIT